MQTIQAILFEPVGCLAEFPIEPFHEIAVRHFGRDPKKAAAKSASRAYWHALNLMEAGDSYDFEAIAALELQAVEQAQIYEDVSPALEELKSLGVELILASSLSRTATARFAQRCNFFTGVHDRDSANGVKAAPLNAALAHLQLAADGVMYLTDTATGVETARLVGIHPILMMNDPDEAKRLAMQHPAGGVVSLSELADFVRLLAARDRLTS